MSKESANRVPPSGLYVFGVGPPSPSVETPPLHTLGIPDPFVCVCWVSTSGDNRHRHCPLNWPTATCCGEACRPRSSYTCEALCIAMGHHSLYPLDGAPTLSLISPLWSAKSFINWADATTSSGSNYHVYRLYRTPTPSDCALFRRYFQRIRCFGKPLHQPPCRVSQDGLTRDPEYECRQILRSSRQMPSIEPDRVLPGPAFASQPDFLTNPDFRWRSPALGRLLNPES